MGLQTIATSAILFQANARGILLQGARLPIHVAFVTIPWTRSVICVQEHADFLCLALPQGSVSYTRHENHTPGSVENIDRRGITREASSNGAS